MGACKVVNQKITDKYAIYNGDNVEVARSVASDSIHYMIFSPPFESLYTYSNSERDMGNARNSKEFARHYAFLLKEMYRTLMPGRLMSIHCMDLPRSKERDGVIGIRDFRGQLIRYAERCGFILHSQVVIWKDPVVSMQRTKALGLLHKTIRKDSSMSRQGIPDYLVTFRKPGDNPEPVRHFRDDEECLEVCKEEGLDYEDQQSRIFPVSMWQRFASPVWMDINPSRTLQRESAREQKDERHICPLQLEVIDRGIELWTNPGDIVADWFGGIGSTGFEALKMGRRTIMTELKASYYRQMELNVEVALKESRQESLFDVA